MLSIRHTHSAAGEARPFARAPPVISATLTKNGTPFASEGLESSIAIEPDLLGGEGGAQGRPESGPAAGVLRTRRSQPAE
jgi:hypothetical protein